MITWLFEEWQRKLIALISAVLIWLFVNNSIIETKTLPNVPVKVVNLTNHKTINGMLSNGYLENRISLTLSGTKDVIENLEAGDLEVLVDASNIDNDNWLVVITKKNLVSLDPSVDLSHHITQLNHPEFVIHLSNLVTEKIPVIVREPLGKSPDGYEFLDIWPQTFTQTFTGPQEEMENLKKRGLKLYVDLSRIRQNELDALYEQMQAPSDEVSYSIPTSWKKVMIPFKKNTFAEINDPKAKNLKVAFLRKGIIPVEKPIPVEVFYPSKYRDTLNPETHKLAQSDEIEESSGVYLYTKPLYLKNVSSAFVDIIRENLKIVIIAAPKKERQTLQWSVEVVDPHTLEDTYVAYLMSTSDKQTIVSEQDENVLRRRFREFVRKLTFYTDHSSKLRLNPKLTDNEIVLRG